MPFPRPQPDDKVALAVPLAAQREPTTPSEEADVIRYLLALPDAEREAIYSFVNKFYELIFDSFRKSFPNRDPSELWSEAPRNDDSMRQYLSALENVQ